MLTVEEIVRWIEEGGFGVNPEPEPNSVLAELRVETQRIIGRYAAIRYGFETQCRSQRPLEQNTSVNWKKEGF